MLELAPREQSEVLSICKLITESSEEIVENLVLPNGSPSMLVQFVDGLKKRIRAARRRRETRAAKANARANNQSKSTDNQAQPKLTAQNCKSVSPDKIIEMYELAVEVVLAAGQNLNTSYRSRIRQLAKTLMKRMDSIAAIAAA